MRIELFFAVLAFWMGLRDSYFHTSRVFQFLGKPISCKLRRLPPSPIIESMFRLMSLSGLMILLMYLMQQSAANILFVRMERIVEPSRNGLSVLVGIWTLMMLCLFQTRLWWAQQLRHTAIA